MKRYFLLPLVLIAIISSCDSTGTSSVQKAIDKKDYPGLVNLCEKYKAKPEKSIAVEMGLEALSAVYDDQLIAKKYFTDVLRRSESESLLVEYAVVSIVSNCDTISFLNLMKKREPFPGNSYLKSAFEKHSIAKSCDMMDQYLSVLSSINYAIDDTIKHYEEYIKGLEVSLIAVEMGNDNVARRVEELSTAGEYYFHIVAAHGDDQYEVIPVREDLDYLISMQYSRYKGSETVKSSMFTKRHAILVTDSKDIGKGLYKFYAYKSGTTAVETNDGFTQDWTVYRGGDSGELISELRSSKERVAGSKAKLKELEMSRIEMENLVEMLKLEKQGYSQLF
jgi:hypothetical protein